MATECGNEPDQWVGKSFRSADYRQDWEKCAAAIGGKRIAGSDTAGTSSSWAASLAADEKHRMSMVTVHQYSAGPDATIATQMARAGVDGINVHCGLGVCDAPIWNSRFQRYTPICAANAADEQAGVYRAMSIYYGLWMAQQMKSGTFLPVTLTTDRNVTAYAVKGDDGRTRVAAVQKDETTAAPAHLDIAVGSRARGADVLRLTGTALGEEATAVQGATVDRQPHRANRVRVRDGRLGVDVAAGSAVVITLDDR